MIGSHFSSPEKDKEFDGDIICNRLAGSQIAMAVAGWLVSGGRETCAATTVRRRHVGTDCHAGRPTAKTGRPAEYTHNLNYTR